jgi:hypothetical protein
MPADIAAATGKPAAWNVMALQAERAAAIAARENERTRSMSSGLRRAIRAKISEHVTPNESQPRLRATRQTAPLARPPGWWMRPCAITKPYSRNSAPTRPLRLTGVSATKGIYDIGICKTLLLINSRTNGLIVTR